MNAWPLIAIGAGLLLLARRGEAAAIEPDLSIDPGASEGDTAPWSVDPVNWYQDPGSDPIASPAPDTWPSWSIPESEAEMAPLQAFLYMIRRAEHSAADVASGRDWTTFYGGTQFSDVSDHPVLTGEKKGVPLPPAWCVRAGFAPGCVSTAAGAFQINVPTWKRLRGRRPYITTFDEHGQTEAAIRLIIERGADQLIAQGLIDEAIYRVAPLWASLPRSALDRASASSSTEQGRRSIAQVMSYYSDGLSMA